jgi:hypothetical protein
MSDLAKIANALSNIKALCRLIFLVIVQRGKAARGDLTLDEQTQVGGQEPLIIICEAREKWN